MPTHFRREADLQREVRLALVRHLEECPLARPWLYGLEEDIECTCDDLRADQG